MTKSEGGARSSRVLDFQATGRVIDKVCEADASLGAAFEPPKTNNPMDWEQVRKARAALSNSISWAYTYRDAHGEWTSSSRAKRRYETLDRVRRLSRDIGKLIADDDFPLGFLLAPYFPARDEDGFSAVGLAQLTLGLEQLQRACTEERAKLKESGLHESSVFSGSEAGLLSTPGNAFILQLAKAFEKAFAQAPAIKFGSERNPEGPFVAFVQAVCAEMREPMSPDAVRKAWDRASSGRTNTGENR